MSLQAITNQFRGISFNDVGGWPPLPKVLLLIFAVGAIGALSYYAKWESQLVDLEAEEKKEEGLKEEFKNKKRQAISLDLRKSQLEEIEKTFGVLLQQLPEKSERSALMTEVNQAGLGHGLQFEYYKNDPEVRKTEFTESPVKITLAGTYHDFGAFVNDVAKLSRIVTVNDIVIKPPSRGAQKIFAPRSNDDILTMETVVKTFYYSAQDDSAEAASLPNK